MTLTLLPKQNLLLLNQQTLKYNEIYELMKQKETRKIVSKESILKNWEFAKEGKLKEKSTVYYQDEVYNNDQLINTVLEKLYFDPIPINSVFRK